MFSYYGSKSKIVHHYPAPRENAIIEPFAGSARYALKYFDRDVYLIDKYDRVVNIWKWLQNASEKDIMGLPDIPASLDNYSDLTDVERDFLGFQWMPGNMYPSTKIGSFYNSDPAYWQRFRKRLSNQLYKIRHWKISCDEYYNARIFKQHGFLTRHTRWVEQSTNGVPGI